MKYCNSGRKTDVCINFATILGIANATSIPIGWWDRGGHEGSNQVVGKGYVSTENSQMVSVSATFTSKYHKKKPNP